MWAAAVLAWQWQAIFLRFSLSPSDRIWIAAAAENCIASKCLEFELCVQTHNRVVEETHREKITSKVRDKAAMLSEYEKFNISQLFTMRWNFDVEWETTTRRCCDLHDLHFASPASGCTRPRHRFCRRDGVFRTRLRNFQLLAYEKWVWRVRRAL